MVEFTDANTIVSSVAPSFDNHPIKIVTASNLLSTSAALMSKPQFALLIEEVFDRVCLLPRRFSVDCPVPVEAQTNVVFDIFDSE